MPKHNKWLVNIFSDKTRIPPENQEFRGIAGLTHIIEGYLSTLPVIAKVLNRNVVFTPPYISLCNSHNNNKFVDSDNTWDDYIDMNIIDNYDRNPPFTFKDNGDIQTELSYIYYDGNIDINSIDNNIQIIILSTYNNPSINLEHWHYINIPQNLDIKYSKYNNLKHEFSISLKLKHNVNNIISTFKLNKYIFVHIRRGDVLYESNYAPSFGTYVYTSPKYIIKTLNRYPTNFDIIISTNEGCSIYKNKLATLLNKLVRNSHRNFYFEDDLFNNLPSNVIHDNYKKFQILHELAKLSTINIGTQRLRLGTTIDFKLEYFNHTKTFYICSYGDSTMLSSSLKKYGNVEHIHSRYPPNELEFIGGQNGGNAHYEKFNGIKIPNDKLDNYNVIFIYINPVKAIFSRFEDSLHLGNIETDTTTTKNDVIAQMKDLYGLTEFYNNYTTPKERNYPIYCVRYEELFEKQNELSHILGIGPLNLVQNPPIRHHDKEVFYKLYTVYLDLIKRMDKNKFIEVR